MGRIVHVLVRGVAEMPALLDMVTYLGMGGMALWIYSLLMWGVPR